jgi:glucose dehydrogenase
MSGVIRATLFPIRRVKQHTISSIGGNLTSHLRITYTTFVLRLLLAISAALSPTSAAQQNPPQPTAVPPPPPSQDWPHYGGAPEGNHFSPLTQINRSNVSQLQVAWTFDTGEEGGLQTNPLIVNGVLYGITPVGSKHAYTPRHIAATILRATSLSG